MGKKLIIKGADFSANRIPTEVVLLSRADDISRANNEAHFNNGPFADSLYEQLQGRLITGIELKPAQAGTLSILKAQSLNSGGSEVITTININSNDIGQIKKYEVNIPVGSTDIICVGLASDTGRHYYNSQSNNDLLKGIGKDSYTIVNNRSLTINWYGY